MSLAIELDVRPIPTNLDGWIPKPGFYQMSNEVYHNGPGISESGAKLLLKSPAHFDQRDLYQETDAQMEGNAFHTYLLEPDAFDGRYIILDPGQIRSAKRKADAEEEGKTLLPHKSYLKMKKMSDSVLENGDARALLRVGKGYAEVSGFWNDPETGVLMKLRIDWLNLSFQTILDVKTSVDSFYGPFQKSIANYKYYWQPPWYLSGLNALIPGQHPWRDFVFCVIEKEPPYQCHVFQPDREMTEEGLYEYSPMLEVYKRCLEAGLWPKADGSMQPISLPGWKRRKGVYYEN